MQTTPPLLSPFISLPVSHTSLFHNAWLLGTPTRVRYVTVALVFGGELEVFTSGPQEHLRNSDPICAAVGSHERFEVIPPSIERRPLVDALGKGFQQPNRHVATQEREPFTQEAAGWSGHHARLHPNDSRPYEQNFFSMSRRSVLRMSMVRRSWISVNTQGLIRAPRPSMYGRHAGGHGLLCSSTSSHDITSPLPMTGTLESEAHFSM